MGGGVGAGSGIDNEPSPRRAAIEKAQAELRREVAVRDERRRELEFLEKGGNPLDFKLADRSPTDPLFEQSLLPTDPLAEHLPSEGKSGYLPGILANGDFAEKKVVGVVISDHANVAITECETPLEWNGKGHSLRTNIVSSMIDLGQTDGFRKEVDGAGVIRGGLKGQYARRNRHRINRFGNGHTPAREQRKAEVEDASPMSSPGVKGILQIATDTTKETETQFDKGSDGLPFANSGAVSIFKQGAGMTSMTDDSPEFNVTTAFNECLSEPIGDKADVSSGFERTWDVSNQPNSCNFVYCVEKDLANNAHSLVEKDVLFPAEWLRSSSATSASLEEGKFVSPISVQANVNDKVDLERGSVNIDRIRNQRFSGVVGRPSKAITEAEGIPCTAQILKANLAKQSFDSVKFPSDDITAEAFGVSDSIASSFPQRNNSDASAVAVTASSLTPNLTPDSMIMEEKRENAAAGCQMNKSGSLRQRDAVRPVLKVKLEEGTSEAVLGPLVLEPESADFPDGKMNGASIMVQDVGKLENNLLLASGTNTAQLGTRSHVRFLGTFGVSTSKFPGVILPWEKEKDPTVIAEAERHKANLSAAAKKAREDVILEEAETIKAALKWSAEWGRRKAFPEPLRRKAHWDFVLEEMAWMANDFMQERLWKRAAAAQVARWIVQERREAEFQETELFHRQREIAQSLASAVTKYWKSVEALVSRNKANTAQHDGSSSLQDLSKNRDDGENSMGISVADTAQVAKSELEKEILSRKRVLPAQEYAINLLRDSVDSQPLAHTEAPPTPERVSEAGIFESWQDQFPEESLYYSVPGGAMEAYHLSIESEWASFQAEYEQRLQEHEAALAEAEVQATAEGTEDSAGVSDIGSTIFANESRSLTDAGGALPSPNVNSKRNLLGLGGPGSMTVGSIPTKRMRTSAVVARQRAAGAASTGIGMASGSAGHFPRSDISSGDTNSQQDELTTLLDGCISGRATDTDSTGVFGKYVLTEGVDSRFKTKKKKKTKHFSGGLNAMAAPDVSLNKFSPGKAGESELNWQQDSHRQVEQRELKRKAEQLSQIVLGSPGTDSVGGLDLPGTPGSQGAQQHQRKIKLAKQSSDEVVNTTAAASASHSTSINVGSTNKLMKQISNRDRSRKNKTGKGPLSQLGIGIPWSSIEDQKIVALVHDLGPNWELVSDIMSSSSQLKGVFRKPKDCRERHKMILERDGGDSPEDSSSSQAYTSSLGANKGGARLGLQRLQGPLEDDTLKTHLECIVQLHQQQRSPNLQNDSQEAKQLVQEHPSHALVCSTNLNGAPFTPLELCEQSSSNGELASNSYTMQPSHANGIGMASMLASASGMRPTAGGIPMLQGADSLQLGTGPIPSSAALNAAAARDARVAASLRPLTAEEQRLQYNRLVAGRGLQPQGISITTGLPIMGLANPSECAVPMLPSGSGAGIMCGLSRGVSLTRTGLAGMGSPCVTSMVSAGMNGMLPTTGVGMPSTCPAPPGAVPGTVNLLRRPREAVSIVRAGRSPEEQRQMLMIQDLQHQAVQGYTQAAAALSNLNNSLSNSVVSSPTQNYTTQQQQQLQHQKQQQLQSHNQLHPQQQSPGTNQQQQQQQAYFMRMARQKRLLQQQHFSANTSLQSSLQPQQSHSLSQQHVLSPHAQLFSQQHQAPHLPQQQHALAPPQSQQQPMPQQQQSVLSLTSSNMQPSAQSPSALPSLNSNIQSPQQQQTLSQPQSLAPTAPGQQLPVQPKQPQQNQMAKHQAQPQGKVSKGMGRGAMLMQGLSTQQGHPNLLPAQLSAPLSGQQMPHSLQGQRIYQPGPIPLGKQLPGTPMAGQPSQLQVQASNQPQASLSQGLPTVAQQQKGFSQNLQAKQSPQPSLILTSSNTSVQPPLSPPATAPQQQTTQLPSLQQPQTPSTLLHSPMPSSQQQQRRPSQQAQSQQRRPQQRQTGNVGLQMPPQFAKNGLQQQGPVASQVSGQPGHMAFQIGNNNHTLGMGSTSPAVIPLSSPLTSGTAGVHSTQWKPSHNFSPMSAGIYNLTRSNSAAATQISPIMSSAGLPASSTNGNTVVTVASTSLFTHPVGAGGLQQQSTVQVGGVHGQKVNPGSSSNGRTMASSHQIGASQRQQAQQQQHSSMQSSHAGSTLGQHARPLMSTSSGMVAASSAMAGASSSPGALTFQGSSGAAPSQPVAMSGPLLMYNGVQSHQTHQPGAIVAQGSAVASVIGTLPGASVTSSGPVNVPDGSCVAMVNPIPKSPE